MKAKHKLPQWLKPKLVPSKLAVCVGWYTEESWTKVKATAIDPDRFEESFQEWTYMAEKALRDLRIAGVNAEKFNIKAHELLAWCLAHDEPNCAASRAEFVSQLSSQSRAGAA